MTSNSPSVFLPLSLLRAVIFDLDGTLLDTETESTHAINRALAQYGAAVTPDIKRAIIGMRSSEWSSYVIKALSLEGKIDPLDLVRQWEENLSARMPLVALMPGASEKVAVHVMATEYIFWETLEKLKTAGASSILVLPIEKMLA